VGTDRNFIGSGHGAVFRAPGLQKMSAFGVRICLGHCSALLRLGMKRHGGMDRGLIDLHDHAGDRLGLRARFTAAPELQETDEGGHDPNEFGEIFFLHPALRVCPEMLVLIPHVVDVSHLIHQIFGWLQLSGQFLRVTRSRVRSSRLKYCSSVMLL